MVGGVRRLPPDRVPVSVVGTPGAELAAGSRLTFEPGGQIELSAPPLQGIGPACAALAADAALLASELRHHGVGLVGLGLDPRVDRSRAFPSPRYDAMEHYFDAAFGSPSQAPAPASTVGEAAADAHSNAGRTMMCGTAAVQVNLDVGATADVAATRWHRAHDLGPTLAAAFANSPLAAGAPSGWKSRRLVVWDELDPDRTASAEAGPRDPAEAWLRYALNANVMLIRAADDQYVAQVTPLTFADWIADGHELG